MTCACALLLMALSGTAGPTAVPVDSLAMTGRVAADSTSAAGVLAPDQRSAVRPVALQAWRAEAIDDTTGRRHAVEISDWYGRRLTVHRYGSYLMLPLFAAEVLLGRELLAQKDAVDDGTRREPVDEGLRNTHRAVAVSLGALFVVNTTTGLWNLWDIRHDGSSSTRRTLHVLSMLAADAGFAVAGSMADTAVDGNPTDARAHRNVALASMGLATLGVSLMWF